jgi:hypothetical protein
MKMSCKNEEPQKGGSWSGSHATLAMMRLAGALG